MEINVHNYKKIKTLSYNDRIVFTPEYIYTVATDHIAGVNYISNEKIFTYIGVNKLEFCNKAYGYCPGGGACPTCIDRDWEALARLIVAIFDKLIAQGKIQPPKTSNSKVSDTMPDIINIESNPVTIKIKLKVKPKIIL